MGDSGTLCKPFRRLPYRPIPAFRKHGTRHEAGPVRRPEMLAALT